MRNSLDSAWLDSQYNNRLRVPDFAQILERWKKAALLAQRSLTSHLDVAFGPAPSDKLDIFPSAQTAGKKTPVLIFIHGGYWRSLDKADHTFVAPSFVGEGVCVVVPNYALCPAVTIDDIAMQTAQAVAWTWRNIHQFGGDPSCIAVVGHSAGGHLAAMLQSCRWKTLGDDLPVNLLSGAMGISGLYDLEPLRHSPYLQGDLHITPATVRRCSPAFFPRPKGGIAKFFAVAGMDESEEFLRHNRLIRDAWGPTSVPVCETVPGANHFSVLESLVDPAGRLHHLAHRLLGMA